MKIAITGGSGFIGTQLCRNLTQQGHEIVIIDIAPSKAFPQQRLDVDIRDYSALEKAIQGCEAIYHLAAEHRDDVTPVSKYYDVNVEGGKNVIKAAQNNNIKRIIFTSTVAIYGLDKGASTETDAPDPFNDYGHSKWQSEQTFQKWAEENKERSLTIIRPVATFGPGNRGNIYTLFKQIASGHFMMIGNGKNHKSIAYVGNLAAFLAYMLSNNSGVHTFNYADKPDLNMKEMVIHVRKALGRTGKVPEIPYIIGLAGGATLDILSSLTGKKFPISAVRVKKFCADTVINADKMNATDFSPPFLLTEGLKEMICEEFVKNPPQPNPDKHDNKAA